ncbi:MAG: type VI secretion system baseplate subunit TssG [Pseudomonadota bacterium]
MATKQRQEIPSVAETLWQDTFDFEFHQVIKLLEQLNPEVTALGAGVTPKDEAVNIKARISLSSSSSDIYSLEQTETSLPPTINVNFWGIAGLQGPLPTPYTELILERMRNKDHTLKDFLDIFNHRLVSILHRIAKKYLPALNTLKPHQTLLGQCVQSFTGTDPQYTSEETLGMHPHSLLFYSGLLWQQPRSAAGLKHILSHYFAVPVSIKGFQGQWIELEPSQWTHIGARSQFSSLGRGAMLGTKVWYSATRSTIRIGPLDEITFRRFLKTGDAYGPLFKVIQFYLPPHHKTDINLVIRAKDVCNSKLDGKTQLGWTSWLKSRKSEENDDQVRLF